MRALLALEDGRYFTGESFGAEGTTVGEVCFNTAMTGYQELLTDPSYRGQIVAMTYPEIGNYGVNDLDQESYEPHVRGFVIEELSPVPSNWRAQGTLDGYLKKWRIPGMQGIDTRALTRHLRDKGAMKGCLTTEPISPEEAVQRAVTGQGVTGMDYVREVTPAAAYEWDPEDRESRRWTIVKGEAPRRGTVRAPGEVFEELPPVRHRIVAYDFGMKRNILRRLRQEGFKVQVVPADATRRRGAGHEAGRRFPFERPGRSRGARLRAPEHPGLDGQDADLRHLPGPPDARVRFWRADVQTEVRPSRRQPAGEGFADRESHDHLAKPWLRRRSRLAARRRWR